MSTREKNLLMCFLGVSKSDNGCTKQYEKVLTELTNLAYKLGIKDQLLGNTRIFFDSKSNKFFASLFAQDSYGYDGKQYTDIEAFRLCLVELKKTFGPCTKNNDGSYQPTSIAFPYKIGCVRGGADWDVVYDIIEDELSNAGYNVEFWRLDLG